ncbi:hypothetical protein PBAL39_17056 [Pedobacter sp. BAL39]|uniref:hypothetical protein n=1 Tax=Pedobacter sp. BAL39 TaxID=391596 RepID=UPI0001559575|nr:hypothetical protein [Pedobacter sp. BAL39]EDM35211.1 hypothetical protein PBAL39_17056 [Pedobacter sp. BAL39]
MKKTIAITILSIFVSLAGFTQIKIKTTQADITLPAEVTKNPVSYSRTANSDGTVSIPKGDYQYDNHNFSLTYTSMKQNKLFLSDKKTGIENRRKRYFPNNSYSQTTISKINGINTLVSRAEGGEKNYYFFYAVNDNYTYTVCGMLEFPKGDETTAKEHIIEILKGIKML